MAKIVGIAAASLPAAPGIEPIRMPQGRPTAERLAQLAYGMGEAAGKYASTFTAKGLSEDFVQRLNAAADAVLAALGVDDAARADRAIARANPGGLGAAPQQDVQAPPTVTLREAMALAAHRDLIARQYAEGFDGLFEVAGPLIASGFSPMGLADALAPPADATACVQRLYLRILGRWPDSHIVRKHGEAVAQSVLHAAQGWQGIEQPGEDPRWAAWDATLKAAGINPGTSADLTVAALLLAGLVLH